MRVKFHLKYILLMVLAVTLAVVAVASTRPETAILSLLALLFGAVPLRAVRKVFGRGLFWIGCLVASAVLIAGGLAGAGFGLIAYAILIGTYSEVEEHGGSVFHAGWVAILTVVGLSALGGGLWLHQAKVSLLAEIRSQIGPAVEQVASRNPDVAVTVDMVMQQLPSVAVIVLMIGLAIALIWESRILSWFKLPKRGAVSGEQLLAFRVSDFAVWIVIVAILGGFLKHDIKWLEVVSINVLNIFFVLYLFQGLAVVAHAFRTFKVSLLWQTFWYVMIVIQLFPMVGLLGFADYWLEFRQRLSRKPAETNKSY